MSRHPEARRIESRRRASLRYSAQAVAIWNEKHPVGTSVIVTMDCGERREAKTRSAAEVLGGHTPVIWLEGITGCYALKRVEVPR